MSTATLDLSADQALLGEINKLRKTDNISGWFYLVREYAVLAATLGLAIWTANAVLDGALAWYWLIPVALVANLVVGAGQHRLATLTHEAAHYMLFRNRLLNELVSEWFCMFPLLGTTHSYRVQHLGHHQYPNDPDRDPDWAQLRMSGHKFQFPMSRPAFYWHCILKQILWPPKLIRYVLVRAAFIVDYPGNTPYRMIRRTSRVVSLLRLAFHGGLIALLTISVLQESWSLLFSGASAILIAALLAFGLLPEKLYAEFFIKPDISVRTTQLLRILFNGVLLTTVAALTLATGRPWWLYFIAFWMIPLGTSFSFYMILRQLVQHGNADTGRYTNTRNFIVNRLIQLAVFPIGNDIHLPHHLFPMVPHYNLLKLHDLLLANPDYREHATEVHGYFVSPEHPQVHPTVVDLLTTKS